MADADATELQGDGEALGGKHPEEEEEKEKEKEKEKEAKGKGSAGIFSVFQALLFFARKLVWTRNETLTVQMDAMQT